MIETPKEAQKRFCWECLGGRIENDCQGNTIQCLFYPYRKKEGHVPVKAHRKNCLYCMGGSYELVDGCNTEDCACHLYRFGKAPNQASRRPSKNTLDALRIYQGEGSGQRFIFKSQLSLMGTM
jgi:hypothetical protein